MCAHALQDSYDCNRQRHRPNNARVLETLAKMPRLVPLPGGSLQITRIQVTRIGIAANRPYRRRAVHLTADLYGMRGVCAPNAKYSSHNKRLRNARNRHRLRRRDM